MEKNDGKMIKIVYLKGDTNRKYRLEKIPEDALKEYLAAFKTSSPEPHQGFFAKRLGPSKCPHGLNAAGPDCLTCSQQIQYPSCQTAPTKAIKEGD